jgi:hypothetical protein
MPSRKGHTLHALIEDADFLGQGEYDFEPVAGQGQPRFVDAYTPESGLVRLSLAKELPPFEATMGDKLKLRCRVSNAEKYVRGEERDRSVKSLRLQVVEVNVRARTRAPKPEPVAA